MIKTIANLSVDLTLDALQPDLKFQEEFDRHVCSYQNIQRIWWLKSAEGSKNISTRLALEVKTFVIFEFFFIKIYPKHFCYMSAKIHNDEICKWSRKELKL